MKRNLFYTLVFSVCFGVSAQNPTENYIKSTIYTAPSTGVLTENDTLVSITYFDGLGRPKQMVSVRGGASRLDHNLLPWKDNWMPGSGSATFFNKNGQESDNERIMGLNPFGKNAMLWRCGNDPDNDGDGGWDTDEFLIDNTVAYRYTVWLKRTGGNSGHSYHGTQNVNNLDGTPNTNPYFWYGDPPQLDQWYLLVGVVHPHDYAEGDTGLSGVYDMQGNKVIDGTEFKWDSATTTSSFRSFLYYSTDMTVKQYFYNPILQKLDGSEASLDDVIFERKAPDVVTPVMYDAFGRQTREYLPYAAPTQHGNIHVDPLAQVEDYYNIPKYGNTANPYSEKILENSPLNRVLKQGAPGNPWMADSVSNNDHSVKFEYSTNTTGEVRLYKTETTADHYSSGLSTYHPTLQASGFYEPARLYKIITKDENWQPADSLLHTTEEFKDFQGRVVLKRTYADLPGAPQAAHDTYYVYDMFGNLSFVIPPKVDTSDGVSQEELNELCYQYVYDHRNRLVEKKLPGKGWEYMVYNKGDYPVFTQDQNLAGQGKWMFTKYDHFGRALYTGFFASTDSREALQTTLEEHSPIYESKTDTPTVIDGVDVYYSNNAFPNTGLEMLTIHYYDTYNFDLNGAVAEDSYGVSPSDMTKTLNTGSKIRVLGTDGWITTVSWYDKKARPIYSYTKNPYLNTVDKIKYKVDFVGKVLETTIVHTKDGQADITSIDKFTYDRMGRLLKHTHQITGHPEEVLAENVYDELGQLIQKRVGNTSAAPLQTVDYSYNIRGWLQQINDVNNLGKDLFSFQLNYNDPTAGTPLYNGNISQTHWRTNNTDNSLKSYTYSYDPLNRITQATGLSGNYDLNSVTYDKNGNILSLNRQGHINEAADTFGVMDDLVYTYDGGNKLIKVDELANALYGFSDKQGDIDYSYDANGNMIADTNKDITSITYNHLNLPTQVTIDGQDILYIYDATGIKQRKVAGGTTTDYAGGYIYENGSLKFFNHAEGYIEPDGAGGYDYVYQYKDHLGNVRVSYSDTNKDGVVDVSEILQENNYYPFGALHRGYNNAITGAEHKYKFNGKEIQDDLGLNLYDYGARFYDPAIAQFTTIDPKASLFGSQGTYVYAANSPVLFQEKNGEAPECCGDGGAGIRHERRNTALLKGQMTKEQFIEENMAEARGAAIGIALASPVDEVTLVAGATIKYGGPILRAGFRLLSKLFSKTDKVNDVAKTGKVILEEGAKYANKGEEKIANMLASEGKEVKVLAESTEKGVRSADFVVDGVKTELKTISNLKSKDLSNAMKKRILSGVGQSKNVIIDVSQQSGATKEVVEQAIKRAFGASENLKSVRVIGDGYDFTRVAN